MAPSHLGGDLVEGPVQRRVRRHVPEQVSLGAQMFHVRTALAPTGQHQRSVDQDLAPVVQRGSFRGNRDARGEVFTEPQSVGKITQCVEPDVGDDLVASRFHNDGKRAGSFHLVDALLGLGSVDVAILRIPGREGHVRGYAPIGSGARVNDWS